MSARPLTERIAEARHKFDQYMLLLLEDELTRAKLDMREDGVPEWQHEPVLDMLRANWQRCHEENWEFILRALERGAELKQIVMSDRMLRDARNPTFSDTSATPGGSHTSQ